MRGRGNKQKCKLSLTFTKYKVNIGIGSDWICYSRSGISGGDSSCWISDNIDSLYAFMSFFVNPIVFRFPLFFSSRSIISFVITKRAQFILVFNLQFSLFSDDSWSNRDPPCVSLSPRFEIRIVPRITQTSPLILYYFMFVESKRVETSEKEQMQFV